MKNLNSWFRPSRGNRNVDGAFGKCHNKPVGYDEQVQADILAKKNEMQKILLAAIPSAVACPVEGEAVKVPAGDALVATAQAAS